MGQLSYQILFGLSALIAVAALALALATDYRQASAEGHLVFEGRRYRQVWLKGKQVAAGFPKGFSSGDLWR